MSGLELIALFWLSFAVLMIFLRAKPGEIVVASCDEIEIIGRGSVFNVDIKQNGIDPSRLEVGKPIKINGTRYKIALFRHSTVQSHMVTIGVSEWT